MVPRVVALAVALWIVGGNALVGTAPCAAQTADERAANHFRAGTSYLSEERYEDALREFEEAYRLSGRPEMLYNLGVTFQRLERWADATDAFERFLEELPESDRAGEARERLSAVRGRAAADAPDDDAQPTPVTYAAATPPEGGAGAGDEGPGTLPWVVLGASAAVGVAALITGLVAHGIHGDLEQSCVDGVCPSSLRGDADTGQALATTSTILTFVAVAGAGVGIVLLAVGGDDEEQLEMGVSPTLAGVSAQARLRF